MYWFSNLNPLNSNGDSILGLGTDTLLIDILSRANSTDILDFGFAGAGVFGPYDSVPYTQLTVWNPVTRQYFNAANSSDLGSTETVGKLADKVLFTESTSPYYSPIIIAYAGYVQGQVSNIPTGFLPLYPSLQLSGEIIQSIVNGGFTEFFPLLNTSLTFYSVSSCPCRVPQKLIPDFQSNTCVYGLYQQAADTYYFNVGSKPFETRTTLGQCMATGNSMNFEGGTKPLFYGNAQVMRVANLDKIRFSTLSSHPKSCNQSVVFTMIGDSCFPTDSISDNGQWHQTAITAYMSAQVQLAGQTMATLSSCPNSLFSTNTKNWCDTEPILQDIECIKVLLPDTRLYLTVEVPVKEVAPSILCLESVTFNSVPIATSLVTHTDYKPLYQFNFGKCTISVDLFFNGSPVIENVFINYDAELRDMLTSLVSVALNTNLRTTISDIIKNDLEAFLNPAFQFLDTINQDQIGTCFTFSTPQPISCGPNQIPIIPPSGCDPCDFCCLCVQAGDCGQKCTQRCACIQPFCNAVERWIDPLWFFLVGALIILILVVLGVLLSSSRGLKLSSLGTKWYW